MREAQKYLAKGQIDKAISEWESLLAASPDANSFNIAGDLYVKKNDQSGAREKFHRAAEIFRKEGFSLKALAIYKKILNIIPGDARSLFALGELSEEKNIASDAVRYYMAAGEIFLKEGRKEEAVHAFYKITMLKPDDLAFRERLAGIFSREGFVEETSHEYVEIARLMEKEGKTDEATEYLERAIEIKPGNRAALTAAASLHEKLGDREKAIDILKLAVARIGKSDVLLLWLAKLNLENGDIDEARQIARELLQMDPENLASARMVADTYVRQGDMKAAWAEYESVLDRLADRNGPDEAIEILEGFRQAEPVEARKKLARLYRLKEQTGAALRELKELVRLLEEGGDAEGALLFLREALDLAPGDGSLLEKLRQLGPGGEGGSGPEKISSNVLVQADGLAGQGRLEEAIRLLEPLRLEDPSNIELHMKLKDLYQGAGDTELAVTECIILAELLKRAGREQEKEQLIGEAFRIDPADARLIERWGARATGEQSTGPSSDNTAAAPEADSGDGYRAGNRVENRAEEARHVERLSEAAFYKDQGLYEEAEKIYREFLSNFPGDGVVKAKLDELAALKLKPDAVITASGDVIKGGGAAAASGEIALDGDIEKLFSDFKMGVEKQLDPGDAEARYNLGIAYKEMGLLEDAIRELKSVINDPLVGIRAASILAACHMERGEFAPAAHVLRGAVKKADPARETHWRLKYDLALACEKNSALEEALELYREISRWNPEFRDTPARMEALKKPARKETDPSKSKAEKAPGYQKEFQNKTPGAGAEPEKTASKPASASKPAAKKNRISYI